MKVFMVFGTRPEAIKMCPVIKEFEKRENIQVVVCATGQHDKMLEQVLDIFDIRPDYNLKIMKVEQNLLDITMLILEKLKIILLKEKPDVLVVHGDTTSAYAAALTGFYLKIPIAHIEAGLRTYNKYSPFPEEFNRQSIDSISDFLFAPTEKAKANLIEEHKNRDYIFVTGNTVIDAMKTTIREDYKSDITHWIGSSRLILITAHRRENLGEPMVNIFSAVKNIVHKFQDVKVIYPMHLNPRVRKIALTILGNEERIKLIEPLNVIDFHNIMNHAYLIITDSGGIQEEAPSLGKPVLVTRDTTERPEGVEAGALLLVGVEREGIEDSLQRLLTDESLYKNMSNSKNPYGDGFAAERTVDILINKVGRENEQFR